MTHLTQLKSGIPIGFEWAQPESSSAFVKSVAKGREIAKAAGAKIEYWAVYPDNLRDVGRVK